MTNQYQRSSRILKSLATAVIRVPCDTYFDPLEINSLQKMAPFTNEAVFFRTDGRTGVVLVEKYPCSGLDLGEIIFQPEVTFASLRLSPRVVLVVLRVKGVQAMYGNNAGSKLANLSCMISEGFWGF